MNTTLEEITSTTSSSQSMWSVDLALRRFCGATDGVDAMLQREFGGGTAFIERPPGALLH